MLQEYKKRSVTIRFIPCKLESEYVVKIHRYNEYKYLISALETAFKHVFKSKCNKCNHCNCHSFLKNDSYIVNDKLEQILFHTLLGDISDSIIYVYQKKDTPINIKFHLNYPDDPNKQYNYSYNNIYIKDSSITNFIDDIIYPQLPEISEHANIYILPENNNYKHYCDLSDYLINNTVELHGKLIVKSIKKKYTISSNSTKKDIISQLTEKLTNVLKKQQTTKINYFYDDQKPTLENIKFNDSDNNNEFNNKFNDLLKIYNKEKINFPLTNKNKFKIKLKSRVFSEHTSNQQLTNKKSFSKKKKKRKN